MLTRRYLLERVSTFTDVIIKMIDYKYGLISRWLRTHSSHVLSTVVRYALATRVLLILLVLPRGQVLVQISAGLLH